MTATVTRRTPLAFATVAAAFVAAALILAPSAADAATPAPQDTATTQSCWTNVDTGESGCFTTGTETPEQAIADATGTNVVAAPTGELSADVVTTPDGVEGTATSYLLTARVDSTNQGGNSSSYFTMDSGICSGLINEFPSLPDFNDKAESFQSFNGCSTTLWQDNGFSGTQFGPAVSSNNLGSFNNKASSMIVTD